MKLNQFSFGKCDRAGLQSLQLAMSNNIQNDKSLFKNQDIYLILNSSYIIIVKLYYLEYQWSWLKMYSLRI